MTPSVLIPMRDDVRASLQLESVDHQRCQPDVVEAAAHQLAERAAGALDEAARNSRARRRPRRLLDLHPDRLLRAPVAAGRDAGEHPLEHDPRERVTVGEMRVRLQWQLAATVDAADARSFDLHASAAQRHLARLVPVTYRAPLPVMAALRAHDLDDLFFHQLGQHSQADTDAEREQPLLRSTDQLAERFLHPDRQHSLRSGHDLPERYGFLLHGGSSFDLGRIASNAPNRSGRGRRDRRQVLRATGQPPPSKRTTRHHPTPPQRRPEHDSMNGTVVRKLSLQGARWKRA